MCIRDRDKTLSYYNAIPGQATPFGDWRMKMNFVVDDDFDAKYSPDPPNPPNTNPLTNGTFHDAVNFVLVKNFEGSTDKPEYNIKKLYLDAFPAQSTACLLYTSRCV